MFAVRKKQTKKKTPTASIRRSDEKQVHLEGSERTVPVACLERSSAQGSRV